MLPARQITILGLNEGFGLTERWHIQTRENIAQMLLCHGRAGGTWRKRQHPGGLVRPSALTIRARGVVDGVLEHAGIERLYSV